MHHVFVSVGFLIYAVAALGCGVRNPRPVAVSPPAVSTPAPPPEARTDALIQADAACDVVAQSIPGEAISVVGLTEPVDPRKAPFPENESERLLFRQLYETLIRVDCNGRAAPGLAVSWRVEPDGQTWILALRENARFSDGTPLGPTDILSAWSSGAPATGLRPQVLRLISSAVAVDERTLAIKLRNPRTDAPLPLAHTDLAVARRVPANAWPLGTRVRMEAAASAIQVAGVQFRLAAGGDARDLLDESVDLLLTRDPRVLNYAVTLPQFQVLPLEWQYTHVFLAPGREGTAPQLSSRARAAFAGDAVRGEARGAEGPFWWESLTGCEISYPSARPSLSPGNGRVVYLDKDNVARDLAERLVGLSTSAAQGATEVLDALAPGRLRANFQRATGVSADALPAMMQRGEDAGYILKLDRRVLDPCREIQVLAERIRWIDPSAIVPLVDTRLQAIVRRGRVGLIAEWHGSLILPGTAQ